MPVVLMEPAWEFESTGLGGVVSATVSPFTQGSLDEAFCFAVGARGVGASETLANAELLAEAAKEAGAISRDLIGKQREMEMPRRA